MLSVVRSAERREELEPRSLGLLFSFLSCTIHIRGAESSYVLGQGCLGGKVTGGLVLCNKYIILLRILKNLFKSSKDRKF